MASEITTKGIESRISIDKRRNRKHFFKVANCDFEREWKSTWLEY